MGRADDTERGWAIMRSHHLVQFMHPGSEHRPDRRTGAISEWKDWNRGDHKRKFLIANGASTSDPKNPPREGKIAFWGEWEPQSKWTVLPESGVPDGPRWLHDPRLDLKAIEFSRAPDGKTQTRWSSGTCFGTPYAASFAPMGSGLSCPIYLRATSSYLAVTSAANSFSTPCSL